MADDHVHTYDEDGDCTRCGHDLWAPKPLPPDRLVTWPVLIAWRIWAYLSWPWPVRQMKAAGFRRVGWMTWECGGEEGAGNG